MSFRFQPQNAHVEKLKKVFSTEHNINDSDCISTSEYVVFLLTGQSLSYADSSSTKIPSNEILAKQNSVYSHQAVKDLFDTSDKTEHSIFYIEHDSSSHAYVIEKETSITGTHFRIYQSWIFEFTLFEWMNGEGNKTYNADQIQNFIQSVIREIYKRDNPANGFSLFCCNNDRNNYTKVTSPIKIMKFKFNDKELEQTYVRLHQGADGIPRITRSAS